MDDYSEDWKKHVRLSFQSPFSFLFCAKTTKIIIFLQKTACECREVQSRRGNSHFSDIQTVVFDTTLSDNYS
jgi:hypothetical protein